ncbi:hypothetical protein ACQ7HM_10305 [Williamsia sp. MIQD14]|uniref:hypothetical protein n=1 Tax=Williamsia sp. MIQD14 TaxID=3425703 RepID=UPI003DA17075
MTAQSTGLSPTEGKRGPSQLKKEKNPAHLLVVRPEKAKFRMSATGPDATGRKVALLWINHPDRPRREPVTVSATQTTTEPLYTLTRPRFGSRITEAKDPHGQVIAIVKAHRFRAVFQTHWTIHSASGTRLFSVTERLRDAVWRRTLGVPSRLTGDAFFLAVPGMLISLVKGPTQMRIKTANGESLGVITFSPGVIKPRENFRIYLDNSPYPLDNPQLTAGVLAAMQRTI